MSLHGKLNVKIFLVFIVAEITGIVNIWYCNGLVLIVWNIDITKISIFINISVIKVCLTKSADLSVFVLFRIIIIFFLLSYFSLPPPASLDFSIISQPISMKFGMLIVLDETKRCLKFQVNRTRGRDRTWSQSFTMLYNRTNSIYCA